jgi:hypothetical protein
MLLQALRDFHGPEYDFAVGRWTGAMRVAPQAGRVIHRFIVTSVQGMVSLRAGDRVRGFSPHGPYRRLDDSWAEATASCLEELWPGDVVCIDEAAGDGVIFHGAGTYFEVVTEATGYCAPRLAMLRHLTDRPGGCAAYPGAFRREALPPQRPAADAEDRRGVNRVNEHTLDMRIDRRPTPIRHYHGPVPAGNGCTVNHSETAIVLPRSAYGLPEVGKADEGRIVIYRRPAEDPSDQQIVPVRPGSIVVTPSPAQGVVAGHCFENAFAMLVAIPGFVAPYHLIHDEGLDIPEFSRL